MKITKAMVNRAENRHFNTESYNSLVKSHALNYLYYKQQGKLGLAKKFLTSPEVRHKVKILESKRIIRRSSRRTSPYGINLNRAIFG